MEASKRFQVKSNVTLRVIDKATGRLVQERKGHNSATNTLLEGVGHYLVGNGVLQQGPVMLSDFIPKYISLGTMGLRNQDEDYKGLPAGLSGKDYTGDEGEDLTNYIAERPGYGTDGYNTSYNNSRPYLGLGPAYTSFSSTASYYQGDIVTYKGVAYVATEDIVIDPDTGLYNYWDSDKWEVAPASKQPTCYELVSPSFPRTEISFRDVVPEYEAEKSKTIDVVFSAMISTGALAQFRDADKDYIFITEAGLWSTKNYQDIYAGYNGLVAGYRMCPPNPGNWYMKAEDVPDAIAIGYLIDQGITIPTSAQIDEAKIELAANNRTLLKEQVLRVERGQVVQVIWKIQIGNIDERDEGADSMYGYQEIQEEINELYTLVGSNVLYAESIPISSSRWSSSGRSDEYAYQASIHVPGVDATYFTMVQFEDSDSISFTFAPVSQSATDTVFIYCATKPNRSITIPLIVCYKGSAVTAT